MDFDIKDQDNVVLFKPLARTIDQANATKFLNPLEPYILAGRAIVIDLSEIQFLNSSGLGALVNAVKDAQLSKARIRLAAPSATVRALFSMVRLTNIVPVDQRVEDAVRALA